MTSSEGVKKGGGDERPTKLASTIDHHAESQRNAPAIDGRGVDRYELI